MSYQGEQSFSLETQSLDADRIPLRYAYLEMSQECTKGKLTCIIDRQVCKSFIQPANGGAQSCAAGVGLSKISVDTEAVAIGYWNRLPGIFRLMLSRCFYIVYSDKTLLQCR